jgi:outer membrane protein assembly factor BamB
MNERQSSRRIRRTPLILTALTVLAVVLAVLARTFREALSDGPLRFDFAIANFVTFGMGLALLVAWCLWLIRSSGYRPICSRWLPVLSLVAVASGIACYRPVFDGAMGIRRWEPRWWSSHRNIATAGTVVAVDVEPDGDAFDQFMGPNRNGVVPAGNIDFGQFHKASVVWKIEVGEGWSGFVAANNACYTMRQVGDQESVICLDINSGSPKWEYRHKRRHDDPLGGVGPRATPALSDGKLYCQGANGMLVCLDASSGELLWKQELDRLLNIPLNAGTTTRGEAWQIENSNCAWGRAGSPLIVDELVVVPGGGPADGRHATLIAFDKRTGEKRWQGGTFPIGYSSPMLFELAGVRQVVYVSEADVLGIDPENGNVLWTFPWPGSSNSDASTSQPVRVSDNRLLNSKGYGAGAQVMELFREGEKWATRKIWSNPRVLKTKLTSVVIRDGFAYAISDGILECADVETGERKWKAGRFGHGQLLMVEDFLLVHSEDGVLRLVRANPEKYEPLEELETVSGVCWNTICLYRNYLLVRSDLEAACIKLPLNIAGESGGQDRQD